MNEFVELKNAKEYKWRNADTYWFNIGGYENIVEIGGDGDMIQVSVPASLKKKIYSMKINRLSQEDRLN